MSKTTSKLGFYAVLFIFAFFIVFPFNLVLIYQRQWTSTSFLGNPSIFFYNETENVNFRFSTIYGLKNNDCLSLVRTAFLTMKTDDIELHFVAC